jgi:hypothetical protein
MLSRHSTPWHVHRGGRRYGGNSSDTPRRFSMKTPHPTRERGAGQCTDLAFPNAPEDDERGGGA